MILKNDSINLILIILILNCFGCSGQINTKKIKSNAVEIEAFTKSDFSVDSVKYNQYQDGQKNGVWREYYKNGELKSESIYIHGKKEGLCKEWWETGHLWTEGIYKNGKANGLMAWYNQEGILVAKGNMVNDQRDGKWKICDIHFVSNCIEANFNKDKKTGIWRVLYENGNVWKEQYYEDNKVLSEKCWDKNGALIKCE